MKKLYVGNLPFSTTDQDLRDMFAGHGQVASASIVTDRETNRSRGFGFVEMADDGQADGAISALNGTEVSGRTLVVNEAKPREPRAGGSRSFGGGGRSFGGGRSSGGDRGGARY